LIGEVKVTKTQGSQDVVFLVLDESLLRTFVKNDFAGEHLSLSTEIGGDEKARIHGRSI